MGKGIIRSWSGLILAVALVSTAIENASAVTTRTNGVLEIHVASLNDGFGYGSWNAITGAGHVAGAGRDILYSGSSVWTNYSSLRVHAGTGAGDYLLGFDTDPYFVSEGASPYAPANRGVRQTWIVSPANIRIIQDVLVTTDGVNAYTDNSAIYHSVELYNLGSSAVTVGWRNLYDWAVTDGGSQEDGPRARLEDQCGGVILQQTTPLEFLHMPVTAGILRLTSDQVAFPNYQACMALTYDPAYVPGLPLTTPDALAFVDWPNAYGTLFNYTVTPGLNTTSDSATLTWYGRTAVQAPVLQPGESVRFTQIIFAIQFGTCIGVNQPNAAKDGWSLYE